MASKLTALRSTTELLGMLAKVEGFEPSIMVLETIALDRAKLHRHHLVAKRRIELRSSRYERPALPLSYMALNIGECGRMAYSVTLPSFFSDTTHCRTHPSHRTIYQFADGNLQTLNRAGYYVK